MLSDAVKRSEVYLFNPAMTLGGFDAENPAPCPPKPPGVGGMGPGVAAILVDGCRLGCGGGGGLAPPALAASRDFQAVFMASACARS